MNRCGQACPYNTLNGCKVKEYNKICPLTNMATPITEYRMTNEDRIRAMSDEELAEFLCRVKEPCDYCQLATIMGACTESLCDDAMMKWLKQPAEGEDNG